MASFTGFGVIGEWFGSVGPFVKLALVPKPPGKPAESKEVLAQWLAFQFQMMVIAQLVYIAYQVVLPGGSVAAGVSNAISLILNAFINAWIFWFGFAKREPACCCFIQGFKYQYLIVGIYFVVMGALQLLNFVQLLIPMLAALNTAVYVYIGFVVVYCFQVIGMIGSGLCMVKMGGKAAGIETPAGAPEIVGMA
jgi:hypothetical protein